jgi:hypothetical protein
MLVIPVGMVATSIGGRSEVGLTLHCGNAAGAQIAGNRVLLAA